MEKQMTTKLEVVHTELDLLEQEVKNLRPPADGSALGRLSAEAVQASYISAAKAVEALKGPIIDRATKLEEALRNCDSAMKDLEEWAKTINDTGHLVAAQIDEANALSAEIRKMAADYITRVK